MSDDKEPAPFFFRRLSGHPYLKLAVYGEAGSGKSRLLASIVKGLAQEIGASSVALLGTEQAAGDLEGDFSGLEVLYRETRTPGDLLEVMRLARAGHVSIVAIDSLTHFWESFLALSRQQLGITTRSLSPTERGDIKSRWREIVSDPLVSDRVHYVVSARASQAYESDVDVDTQKRESYASGLRIRAEGDSAYEANLVVRLERKESLEAGKLTVFREAVVEKDRTGAIDGRVFRNATWADLAPAVQKVLASRSKDSPERQRIDAWIAPPVLFHGPGSGSKARERDQRKALLLEEIRAWLDSAFPGSGKDSVKGRNDFSAKVFGTYAASFPGALDLEVLEVRHGTLQKLLMDAGHQAPSALIGPKGQVISMEELSAAWGAAIDSKEPTGVCGKAPSHASDLLPKAPDPEGVVPATAEHSVPKATPSPNTTASGSSSEATPANTTAGGRYVTHEEALKAWRLDAENANKAEPSFATCYKCGICLKPGDLRGACAPCVEKACRSAEAAPMPSASCEANEVPTGGTASVAPPGSAPGIKTDAGGSGGARDDRPGLAGTDVLKAVVVARTETILACPLGLCDGGGSLKGGTCPCRIGAAPKRDPKACHGCGEPVIFTDDDARGCFADDLAGPSGEFIVAVFCSALCRKRWRGAGRQTIPAVRSTCPAKKCDGSGWMRDTGERCLCKVPDQGMAAVPKKSSEPLPALSSVNDVRARLGTSRIIEARAKDLLADPRSGAIPFLAKQVLQTLDGLHGREVIDTHWLAVGGRLSAPTKNGKALKRLGVPKATRALILALVARCPVLEWAGDRKVGTEKDDVEVPATATATAPSAGEGEPVHPW